MIVLGVACIWSATSALLGQAQTPPSNVAHMEELSWMIGEWKGEVDVEEAIPGLAEMGDKLSITLRHEWRLNKNAISTVWFIETASGVRLLENIGMTGWDPSGGTYVTFDFNSLGARSSNVFSRVGDKWHENIRSVLADGTTESSTVISSNISKNSFSFEVKNRKRGGEELGDDFNLEFRRVK